MSIKIRHPNLGLLEYPEGTDEATVMADVRRRESRGATSAQTLALSGGFPSFENPEQALQVGSATARLAPMAAGIAVAPPTVLGASLTGAGTSMIGEYLANVMDSMRDPEIKRNASSILAAGIAGGTPMFQSGGLLMRGAKNLASNIGFSEISNFMGSGGDLSEPESVKKYIEETSPQTAGETFQRYGLPAITAGLGSLGGRTSQLSEEAAANRVIAGQGRGIKPTVMLSEAVPDMAVLEQKAYARSNQQALQRLASIRSDIGGVIAEEFPAVTSDNVRQTLMAARGKLENLQRDARIAADEAFAAQQEADRLGAISGEGAKAAIADARLRAFKAQALEAAYGDEVLNIFGANNVPLSDVALGARDARARQLARGSDEFIKSVVDAGYEASGVKRNTRVLSADNFSDVMRRASARRGSPLNDPAARDLLAGRVAAAMDKFAPDGLLSYDNFIQLRGDLIESLELPGQSEASKRALRQVAYDVVSEAADEYMAATNPNALAGWKTAQALAATRFKAVNSTVFRQLVNGESDQLFKEILEGGKESQAMTGLMDIEKMLKASFNPADTASRDAAMAAGGYFRRYVYDILREGALGNAQNIGTGIKQGPGAFDTKKMITMLDTLDTRGIPVGQLGLGTPKQIRALARIQNMTGVTTVTREDLNLFLDQVQALGEDRAAWATAYRNAVRDELIASDAGSRAKAAARAREAFRNAKLNAENANALLLDAKKDALVEFMGDTNVKLSGDDANNAKFVTRIMTMPESQIKGLVTALEQSKRGSDLEELRIAATTQIMRQFESVANGSATTADLQKIGDFFFNQNSDAIAFRNQYRALLGEARFKNLKETFGRPVMRALETDASLRAAPREGADVIQSRIRTTGSDGLLRRVAAIGNLNPLLDLARDKQYSILYKMYVDPEISNKIRQAGGALDVAINRSPALGTLLNIYRARDEENKRRYEQQNR